MSETQAAPEGASNGEAASSNVVPDPASERIAALKARRAAAAAPPAPKVETTPKTETPPAAATTTTKTEAEVDLTDAELKQFTTLSRESRKDKARIKELEADAAKMQRYRELKAEGKFEEAAALIEFDVDATVAKRLTADVKLTPEQQQIADLKKDVDAVKADTDEQKKRDADLAAANAAAAKEKNSQTVIAFVADKKAEFPFLSRNPAWVATAYDQALDAFGKLPAAERPKTHPEREAFVRAFLDEAEAEHAETARLYGATPAPNQLTDRSQARNPPAANGNRQQQASNNQPKKLTFEEVRYRRRNRA